MTAHQAPWLQRWLQRDDDVLLYWDVSSVVDEGPLTREAYVQAMQDHAQEAIARERTRQIIEERLAWAQAREEQRDAS